MRSLAGISLPLFLNQSVHQTFLRPFESLSYLSPYSRSCSRPGRARKGRSRKMSAASGGEEKIPIRERAGQGQNRHLNYNFSTAPIYTSDPQQVSQDISDHRSYPRASSALPLRLPQKRQLTSSSTESGFCENSNSNNNSAPIIMADSSETWRTGQAQSSSHAPSDRSSASASASRGGRSRGASSSATQHNARRRGGPSSQGAKSQKYSTSAHNNTHLATSSDSPASGPSSSASRQQNSKKKLVPRYISLI